MRQLPLRSLPSAAPICRGIAVAYIRVYDTTRVTSRIDWGLFRQRYEREIITFDQLACTGWTLRFFRADLLARRAERFTETKPPTGCGQYACGGPVTRGDSSCPQLWVIALCGCYTEFTRAPSGQPVEMSKLVIVVHYH